LKPLAAELLQFGLNLCSVLPVAALPDSEIAKLPRFGSVPIDEQHLVLIGNAGPAFWQAMQSASTLSSGSDQSIHKLVDNPVDRFAREASKQALDTFLAPAEFRIIYPILPGEQQLGCVLSLQTLGALAGWHQDSPLGIGIHRVHGLWFAYRCLALVDHTQAADIFGEKSYTPISENYSTCLECKTQDCLVSCPAHALELDEWPDIQSCVTHRAIPNSSCAVRCLARDACPVGQTSRYPEEQIVYHYAVSLKAILTAMQSNNSR